MGWWIALIIIAALCALLLFLPVRVLVRWYKNPKGKGLEFAIKISFFKLKIKSSGKTKAKSPSKKNKQPVSEKKLSVTERIKGGISLYRLIADDVKDILGYTATKAFRFELIHFNFHYGTGDAAATGILFGVISGIVHGLVGIIANFARVDRSEIFINPDFYKTSLETDGECIVKLQNVHIIVIIVKAVKLYLKIKKGKESEKNGRTSNSGLDGHSNE